MGAIVDHCAVDFDTLSAATGLNLGALTSGSTDADHDEVGSSHPGGFRLRGSLDPPAHEQRPLRDRRAARPNDLLWNRALRTAPRVQVHGLHPDQLRRGGVRRRQLRLVGRQRARLAHRFDARHAAAVDQDVGGGQRRDGMALEEWHRAHVLFDQVLRVAAGDEREEQHQIHLVGQLHRRAGEQGQREPRRGRANEKSGAAQD